jgi:membrane protease YdiL (CAAX protease family)
MSKPMVAKDLASRPPRVPSLALLPFTVITFAISWGILGVYILRYDLAARWFGDLTGRHPAFVLAVWAPAIAAWVLVLHYGGMSGFGAYLSRLRLWRCSWSWAAFLLFGVPLTFLAGALLKGNLPPYAWPFDSPGAALGAMAFMLILGPVEEFGWRGLAQPILQRHMAPLWAGLLIGATWGLWHLPAFLLSGTVQSGWGFGPFFVGNLCLAVIVTPLFNASRGSILLPAVFHYQLINPLWPDAQPYDTLCFLVVAVVVFWLNRDAMLHARGAATEVIPRARHDGV